MPAREFDQQFEKYLKDRFKAFRDKERPADYGQDLSPDPERSNYTSSISIEPSPSGDLIAVMTGNRRDQELDIILVSSKDGSVVRNLTPGFDMDRGFEYIAQPSLSNMVPWMSWSPVGDRLAYFVRNEKHKTLIIQNVLTGKIEHRFSLQSVDNPESPNISPDGRSVLFSGLRSATGDIFRLDINSGDITNLTNDEFADYAPVYSPDGSFIVYMARISGSQKLFRLDVDTARRRSSPSARRTRPSAKFLNADTIVFSSTATDPATPLTPEVARNGNIFNLWSLSLKNGELKQYTDALGGVLSPVVLSKDGAAPRLAFVDYYKGSYTLHTFDLKEPLHTAASADFGIARTHHRLPGAAAAHARRREQVEEGQVRQDVPRRPAAGERRRDEQRRRVRRIDGVVHRRARRSAVQHVCVVRAAVQDAVVLVPQPLAAAPVGAAGLLADAVLLRTAGAVFLRPGDRAVHQPGRCARHADGARRIAVRHLSVQHLSARRALGRPGALQRGVRRPGCCSSRPIEYQQEEFGTQLFNSGMMMPLGVSFIQETTVFREYGPLSGSTMRLSFEGAPKLGNSLSRTDPRRRRALLHAAWRERRVCAAGLRLQELGDAPSYTFFGGNSEMRGYEYREFLGHKGFYTNAELRFPLIHAMATPIGILGGIRGVFFANLGGAGLEGLTFKVWDNNTFITEPVRDRQRRHHPARPAHRRLPARTTRARPTASASRPSRSASRCTSTGRTARCSTRSGKTTSSAAASEFRKAAVHRWIGYDF